MTKEELSTYGTVLLEIDGLGRLSQGWDSYDADPVGHLARKNARSVVELCGAMRVPPPTLVAPTPDGSVELSWAMPTSHGVFEIHAVMSEAGTNELYAGHRDEPGFVRTGKVCDSPEGVATSVNDLLTKHTDNR